MGAERSFAVELPLPAHWNGVEKLDIKPSLFEMAGSLR
jgi:hypothetical protein